MNGWIILGYLYSMCVILLYDLKFVSPLKNSDLKDEICFWEWSLFGGHVNVQGGKPIFGGKSVDIHGSVPWIDPS